MTTYFDDYMSMYLGDLTLSMYKPMYLLLGNQKHTFLITYLLTNGLSWPKVFTIVCRQAGIREEHNA